MIVTNSELHKQVWWRLIGYWPASQWLLGRLHMPQEKVFLNSRELRRSCPCPCSGI